MIPKKARRFPIYSTSAGLFSIRIKTAFIDTNRDFKAEAENDVGRIFCTLDSQAVLKWPRTIGIPDKFQRAHKFSFPLLQTFYSPLKPALKGDHVYMRTVLSL